MMMCDFVFDTYPLVIVADRYDGAYSGGKFTAWNAEFDEIPPEIVMEDCVCADFWNTARENGYIIGVGDNPREAALDLYINLKWSRQLHDKL